MASDSIDEVEEFTWCGKFHRRNGAGNWPSFPNLVSTSWSTPPVVLFDFTSRTKVTACILSVFALMILVLPLLILSPTDAATSSSRRVLFCMSLLTGGRVWGNRLDGQLRCTVALHLCLRKTKTSLLNFSGLLFFAEERKHELWSDKQNYTSQKQTTS